MVPEHRPQFARRSGQHHQPACAAIGAKWIRLHFHRQTGGGAVRIIQRQGAFRNHRLDLSPRRHRSSALLEKFLEPRKDRGIVLVDHDVELLTKVCDRLVCLDGGKVIAIGAPAEVRTDARVRASFLGVPA